MHGLEATWRRVCENRGVMHRVQGEIMVEQSSTVSGPGFERRNTPFENLLAEVGRALQVLEGSAQAGRPNPAGPQPLNAADQETLSASEQRHAAGLMRVNHVGEVCAQALYRGQAMFCEDPKIRQVLYHAAAEEVDHLAWCRDRLQELNSRPSLLNPLWYVGSFSLGALASRAGIPRNLGFMAETERQVEQHLDGHLQQLPAQDTRSRKIVEQMRDDEIQHRTTAETNGAASLPAPVKLAMRLMSKVMTVTAYRL
jgi:ubiquinone biosynthesis monooxygenase Coq7